MHSPRTETIVWGGLRERRWAGAGVEVGKGGEWGTSAIVSTIKKIKLKILKKYKIVADNVCSVGK